MYLFSVLYLDTHLKKFIIPFQNIVTAVTDFSFVIMVWLRVNATFRGRRAAPLLGSHQQAIVCCISGNPISCSSSFHLCISKAMAAVATNKVSLQGAKFIENIIICCLNLAESSQAENRTCLIHRLLLIALTYYSTSVVNPFCHVNGESRSFCVIIMSDGVLAPIVTRSSAPLLVMWKGLDLSSVLMTHDHYNLYIYMLLVWTRYWTDSRVTEDLRRHGAYVK